MKKWLGLAAAGGLVLLVVLTVQQGVGAVLSVLDALGWGLLLAGLIHMTQVVLAALAWEAVLARDLNNSTVTIVCLRWIRESINGMLPMAQIGGEVFAARILSRHGVSGGTAGASIVVDTTLELVTQILFTLIGLALLFGDGRHDEMARALLLATLVSALIVTSFVIAQRHGLFHGVEKLLNWFSDRLPTLELGQLQGLHDSVHRLYANPRAVLAGCFWHLLSWLVGAVEIWLILDFSGIHISWKNALLMESLGQAARSAAFMVPGALGVQEGAYMLIGSLVGLPPPVSLGLSLARRARELLLGLPGLLVWLHFSRRPAALLDVEEA